jgi:hypothetical protein
VGRRPHAEVRAVPLPDPTLPARIDPDAIYTDGELRLLLDLPDAALTRERRAGRLRCRRVGRRTYYLGRWVLDWLTAGEAANA